MSTPIAPQWQIELAELCAGCPDLHKAQRILEAVNRLRDTVAFYANKGNWDDRWVDGPDEESSGDVWDVIEESDKEYEWEGEVGKSELKWIGGGARARQTIQQLESSPSVLIQGDKQDCKGRL